MAGVVRKIIKTVNAPAAIGPYSQAVLVENTMYLSGQIGLDPATGSLVPGGIVPETMQALKNLGAVLNAANADFSHVVKATVLLQNINDFAVVNDIYAKYFPKNFPARAAYQVAALPKGAQIEIEAVAIIGNIVDDEQLVS